MLSKDDYIAWKISKIGDKIADEFTPKDKAGAVRKALGLMRVSAVSMPESSSQGGKNPQGAAKQSAICNDTRTTTEANNRASRSFVTCSALMSREPGGHHCHFMSFERSRATLALGFPNVQLPKGGNLAPE